MTNEPKPTINYHDLLTGGGVHPPAVQAALRNALPVFREQRERLHRAAAANLLLAAVQPVLRNRPDANRLWHDALTGFNRFREEVALLRDVDAFITAAEVAAGGEADLTASEAPPARPSITEFAEAVTQFQHAVERLERRKGDTYSTPAERAGAMNAADTAVSATGDRLLDLFRRAVTP